MVTSPNAPTRDDDPAHPNFDGIVFYATTDRAGIIATPATGQSTPPISYLPLAFAIIAGASLQSVIARIREADPKSYLADYLDDMLSDLSDAISICEEAAA